MKELHVKSLLPVRLDKYLMDQYPALGLGRERSLGQPALAVQLPGHEGQGQAKGPGRLQVLGRGEQELPRGRMCHRKEPPCPLVSVRV